MRRASSTGTVATAAACTLLTGLVAVPASAAPGDPLPEWEPRPEIAHREVSVNDSGRVFVDANSDADYDLVTYLEHGYEDEWVRIQNRDGDWADIATGPDGYAVNVRFDAYRAAHYRLFDGETWSDPAVFHDGPVQDAAMDANSDGDVSVLLRLEDDGAVLARLPRGGEWTVQEVPDVPTGIPAGVVLNEQGKTTVAWAAPDGETSRVLRSIVREGSTTLTPPQYVGTVNDPSPNLTIVSDGEGRETIVGNNRLWRQPHTSQSHEYRMRTSIWAVLATGDSATRVVWPAVTADEIQVRSVMFDDEVQRPQTTLWSHPRPPESCYGRPEVGVGMVPGGRSYVGVAVERDLVDEACEDITAFFPVSRFNGVLNEQPLGTYTLGGPIQVEASSAGPVAVEFKHTDEHADPDGPDGYYSMFFFHR